MKKSKRKTRLKPCKAWALVDPQSMQIEPHMVFDTHVNNGGRGSITEGWRCVRVEIRARRAKPRLK